MRAETILLVVGVVTLVGGLSALAAAAMFFRRARRPRPATTAIPHTLLDPAVLVAPGSELAHGRLSRAALLGLIVGESQTAIVVVDRHRDVVLFNEQARSLGLVRDRLIDDRLWASVADMFNRAVTTAVVPSGTVDHDADVDFEFTPPHFTSGFVATGRVTSRPVLGLRCIARLINADPSEDGSGLERYVVIYGQDDSENLRVEATRRDFVANVSHELKTPVGAIGLLGEALLESHEDPESVEHFGRRVIAEAKRMGNMVNELISLSRLQGAEPLTDLEIVDVDALIAQALDNAQIPAEAAGITLDTDDPSELKLRGDFSLLLTALDNLITNAIAYSPPDTHVSITRRVETSSAGVSMVAIAVTDRGIGIAPRDQQRVFERFFRVDKARSRATGGTGLGLAIVKHIAANHDGTISLWSKPGTGSTFTLSIPRYGGPGTSPENTPLRSSQVKELIR